MRRAMQISPPVFEHFPQSLELTIVNIVVPLRIVHRLREIGYWVKDFLVVPLHEHGANCIILGVHFYFEWFRLIWLYQHRFFANDLFQLVERFLFGFFPDPFGSLFQKVIERSCDVREPLDKPPIEIPESQDLTDFFNISGSPPVLHSSDFDWVHSNHAVFQYNSQEFNSFNFELTLSRFQI